MTPALPKTIGRFGRLAPMAGEDTRIVATDGVVEREVEIVRLPFERARRAERDALLSLLRDRTSVVHPAVRAVMDAGEWDDDAFAALELLRGETPLETWLSGADAAARARAAAEILGAAAVLSERGIALEEPPRIVVDDYGQPKVLGLEHARASEPARTAVTLESLVASAAFAAPAPFAVRIRGASTASARAVVGADLERAAGSGARSSLAADAARGEARLSAATGSRHMLVALAVLCFFVLLVSAALVILR